MKRKITFLLAALLLMSGLTWAQTTISWTAADQGYENQQEISSVEFDANVTGDFYKGTNSNAPKYFTTGAAIRCYGGNYFIISSSDANLTSIVLTFASGEGTNAITTDVGEYSNGTWTGDAESVTFTIGGTTGHRRIAAFAITYGGEAPTPTAATPTFSPAEGTYTEAQSVEISCTTEGATIYYTLDGNEPTSESTEYTEALTIEETTTVKAFAVKEGYNNSPVVSATYTITAPAQEQIFSRIDGHAVEAGQTYLIVDIASGRALTSANGSGSSPAAVEVTIENNQISTNNTDLQWTFEATEGGFIIYPLNSTTTWLYSTASNSGVRVGTNNNKVWTLNITDSGKPSYHGFKHNGTERYLGVYNNQDWRAYGSITTNIENTQIELFVLGDIPYVTPPSISADNVEIEYDATSGSIEYTINNPAGGTLSASVDNATCTIAEFELDAVGETSVSFSCLANEETTARTATVTLTYTYGEESVTKDVTVTQAAAPEGALTTIQAIFDKATAVGNTATDVNITFDNWVVSGVSTNGKSVFVTDGTKGFIIFGNSPGFVVGNVLSGTASCKVQLYKGSAELTNLTATTEGLTVGENGEITVATIALSEIDSINTGALVSYENLTYHNSTNNYFQDEAGNQIKPFNTLFGTGMSFIEGHVYNVTGVYQQFDTTKEILPRSAADIEDVTPAVPSITVNPTTAQAFTYVVEKGPSADQLFEVTGENLTSNDITVTVTENGAFEMISDNYTDYGYALTIASGYGFFVRMKAGLEVGTYTDNITISSEGAADVVIALTGTVTIPLYTWDLTTNSYSSASADTVVWSSDYAIMTNLKGSSSSPANNYLGGDGDYTHTRFYKNQILTISSNTGYTIDSVLINAISNYVDGFVDSTWTNATTSANGAEITVIPDNGNEPMSVIISKACRATAVTVYYEADNTPRITATDVEIGYSATSGEIEYTLVNPVEGGVLTASVHEGSWITLGTIGETVPFTCAANTAYTARTATITLTYTYGEESVNKDVTITQAAAPEPSITLAPEVVNVSAEGGLGGFAVSLANIPTSGPNQGISVWFYDAQPEWIPSNGIIYHNFYLNPMQMDSLYLTVLPNTTTESRSVDIKLVINGIVSNLVTITQAAPEAPHYTWDLAEASYVQSEDPIAPTPELITWICDYATMTNEKDNGSTGVTNYIPPTNTSTRFYKNNVLTIAPASGYQIDSVVFIATTTGYASVLKGSTWENATADVDGTTVTVTPTDGNSNMVATIGGTCGFTAVTVYYSTSSIVYYNITLSYGEHGIITSDKTTAREGDTVIIAIIPDEYYYISAYGFAYSVGSSLNYVEIEPNVYRVIMPACDLSVSATFDTYYDLHTITIDEDIENGTVVADKVEAPENALVTLTVTPAAGYILEDNNLIVVANSANVELTKVNATTYTFYMPAENVTVTAEFTAIPPTTYTRATYIESGRHYIIVGFNDDDAYAMGQQNSNNRAAVAISVDGNVATVNNTDGVYEFVINGIAGVNKTPFANSTANVYVQYTIYDPASSGYLYAASSGSNNLKTETHLDTNDNALWYVSHDYNTGITTVVAYGTNTRNRMRYNSGNNVFSCYDNPYSQDVYLYVKDEETPTYDFYKDVKGYGTSDGGYCLIATPTNDAANPSVVGMITDDGTNPEGFTYDLYGFDFTQDQEWRNYRSNAFNMNNGQGYLYANKNNVTLHFQGAPYTQPAGGPSTIGLSKVVTLQFDENNNHTFNGFNLVGNPLPMFAAVYRDFYAMNVDGTEVELAERTYVNPMEGVFMKATEANQTVWFEEWIQMEEWDFDNLGVRVSGDNGSSDFARIRFGEGRNLEKFMLNQNHTKLYFTQGNKDFAVVRSANEGEMPVNFKAETNGNYTISVNAENVEMNYLHLIDNLTGADVDLLATPSYSFEANTNDYATRFRLVFKANANVPENADADTFAFFNGNEWVVSNIGEATLQVVDMTGRVLSSEIVNGNAEISINQTPGVYMLRLVNGDNVKVQKVVVK